MTTYIGPDGQPTEVRNPFSPTGDWPQSPSQPSQPVATSPLDDYEQDVVEHGGGTTQPGGYTPSPAPTYTGPTGEPTDVENPFSPTGDWPATPTGAQPGQELYSPEQLQELISTPNVGAPQLVLTSGEIVPPTSVQPTYYSPSQVLDLMQGGQPGSPALTWQQAQTEGGIPVAVQTPSPMAPINMGDYMYPELGITYGSYLKTKLGGAPIALGGAYISKEFYDSLSTSDKRYARQNGIQALVDKLEWEAANAKPSPLRYSMESSYSKSSFVPTAMSEKTKQAVLDAGENPAVIAQMWAQRNNPSAAPQMVSGRVQGLMDMYGDDVRSYYGIGKRSGGGGFLDKAWGGWSSAVTAPQRATKQYVSGPLRDYVMGESKSGAAEWKARARASIQSDWDNKGIEYSEMDLIRAVNQAYGESGRPISRLQSLTTPGGGDYPSIEFIPGLELKRTWGQLSGWEQAAGAGATALMYTPVVVPIAKIATRDLSWTFQSPLTKSGVRTIKGPASAEYVSSRYPSIVSEGPVTTPLHKGIVMPASEDILQFPKVGEYWGGTKPYVSEVKFIRGEPIVGGTEGPLWKAQSNWIEGLATKGGSRPSSIGWIKGEGGSGLGFRGTSTPLSPIEGGGGGPTVVKTSVSPVDAIAGKTSPLADIVGGTKPVGFSYPVVPLPSVLPGNTNIVGVATTLPSPATVPVTTPVEVPYISPIEAPPTTKTIEYNPPVPGIVTSPGLTEITEPFGSVFKQPDVTSGPLTTPVKEEFNFPGYDWLPDPWDYPGWEYSDIPEPTPPVIIPDIITDVPDGEEGAPPEGGEGGGPGEEGPIPSIPFPFGVGGLGSGGVGGGGYKYPSSIGAWDVSGMPVYGPDPYTGKVVGGRIGQRRIAYGSKPVTRPYQSGRGIVGKPRVDGGDVGYVGRTFKSAFARRT